MPNANYLSGRLREYKALKELRDAGWICGRSAGSHGLFDIWAVHPEHGALFLQIKSTKVGRGSARYIIRQWLASPPTRPSPHYTQGIWVWTEGCWHKHHIGGVHERQGEGATTVW